MTKFFKRIAADTAGASAIEYAIIASVISVAALSAYMAVGEESNKQMENISTSYAEAQG